MLLLHTSVTLPVAMSQIGVARMWDVPLLPPLLGHMGKGHNRCHHHWFVQEPRSSQ